MKSIEKPIVGLLLASLLLQPLGLVTPVLAETVEMKYTDLDHIHAPSEVSVCNSAIDCAPDDAVTYEYDANGNLVNDGERRIDWNQDNLPIRITKGDQVVEFFYDANGQRVAKEVKDTTGATTSKTIYVNQYLEITQLPNNTISQNYYFANGRIASRSSAPGSPLTFLHQDHLGSTALATGSDSQPLSDTRLAYFPYGEVSTGQGVNVSTNYLFTGQEKDPESALYNYNARLYNPTTGAFISADSVGGGNRYSYAKNNPMVFTDPTGHMDWAGDGGGGEVDPLEYEITTRGAGQPGITATTPINTTNTTNPSLDDWFLTEQEYWQWIAFMSDFGAITMGITTFVIALPTLPAYIAYLYNYYFSRRGAQSTLDIGIGEGGEYLEKIPKGTLYVGADTDIEALQLLKDNYPDVQVVVADINNLPFASDTFGQVKTVFPGLYFDKHLFPEINRVLLPSGSYNLYSICVDGWVSDMIKGGLFTDVTVASLSPKELKGLGTYFSLLSYGDYSRYPPNTFGVLSATKK